VSQFSRVLGALPGKGWFFWGGAVLTVVCVFLLYFPGLYGGFLLDDYQNLRLLSEIKPPLNWRKILDFVVLQAGTSFAGRIIPAFSFALQYQSWPLSPAAFKLVNLLIHLLNGGVVYLLALRIGRLLSGNGVFVYWASLWAATFWLIHPINVSTTLYVVQRMAQMSSLFMLFAALLYLMGRERLQQRPNWRAYALLTGAVVGAGGAAFISKENGVLTPVVLLAIESSLFAGCQRDTRFKLWLGLFLVIPTLIIVAYLVGQTFLPKPVLRDFDVYQRLLTQPRVLADYLGKILLPRPKAFGLYFDDFVISRGLLQPFSTVWVILGFAGIVLCAVHRRAAWRAFAFAVFWFVAGHLVESSSIMLEIYFEHRNYFPMIGIAIALPHIFATAMQTAMARRVLLVAGLGGLAILAFVAHVEIRLWANPAEQAYFWGKERPNSLRAQEAMAGMYAIRGDTLTAYRLYMQAHDHFPLSAAPLADAMVLPCFNATIPLPPMSLVRQRFSSGVFSFAPLSNTEQIVMAIEESRCAKVEPAYLRETMQILLQNPAFSSPQYVGHIYFMMARLYAVERDLRALIYADMSLEAFPRVDIALYQIEWMLSAGLPREAESKLLQAETIAHRNPLKNFVYQSMFTDYHNRIKIALQKAERS
jgi:hypothetical protein